VQSKTGLDCVAELDLRVEELLATDTISAADREMLVRFAKLRVMRISLREQAISAAQQLHKRELSLEDAARLKKCERKLASAAD